MLQRRGRRGRERRCDRLRLDGLTAASLPGVGMLDLARASGSRGHIYTKPVELDITNQLTMQDREMDNSIGYANDHADAIDLVRSGRVDLAPFITSRIRADEIIEQGFTRLITDKDSEVKILVSMR